jgi:DNA invertase Pin-like site-specific DNA recombinase
VPTTYAPFRSLSTIQAVNTATICRKTPRKGNRDTRPATAASAQKHLAKHPAILALVREGVSAKVIARRLNVSIRTVSRVRVAAGLPAPSKGASESDKLRAKELLEDGASYAEVGRTIGFHPQHVKRWFPGYEWTVEQRNEMADMERRMAALTFTPGIQCDRRKRPWEHQ